MSVLVIVPAYNEEKKVFEVVSDIKLKTNRSLDVLVIDDGSKDNTFNESVRAGAKALRHVINRGQGAALKTGIDFAIKHKYDSVVFFDADGQMDSAEIQLILSKLDEGYDVVLGSRNLGRAIGMPMAARIVKKMALIFTRFTTGLKLTDTHNGFQAWKVSSLAKINLNQDRMAHASQILGEIGRLKFKYCEVPVTIRYTDYSKRKGQSLWKFF